LFYLRKKDLKKLIKDQQNSIQYNKLKIEKAGDKGEAQILGCINSITDVELSLLQEVYTDYYEKGLWKCRFCHRQIHSEPEIDEGAIRCPKCYALLELDGQEIEK